MSRSPPACPLLRSTQRISRALIRAHCRLRGEVLKAERGLQPRIQPEAAQKALVDIKVVLGFLGVDFDPSALRAVSARSGAPDDHPLGIATYGLARDLLRLHMRLKGELIKHIEGETALVRPAKVQRLLGSIAGLMEFLEIDFQPKALPSIRTRIHVSPLGHGGMRSGVVRALKDTDKGLTYDELTQAILARSGEQLSPDRYRHFRQKIREACHALAKRGRLEADLRVGLRDGLTRQRWRIRRRPLGARACG